MSGSKKIDINSLYTIVLRETENEAIQEIDPNLYTLISNFIHEEIFAALPIISIIKSATTG